jgi:hypothetical protein
MSNSVVAFPIGVHQPVSVKYISYYPKSDAASTALRNASLLLTTVIYRYDC